MVVRIVSRVFPDSVLHRAKKSYYAYLMKHTPEDWMERDSIIARLLISRGDSVLDIGRTWTLQPSVVAVCWARRMRIRLRTDPTNFET